MKYYAVASGYKVGIFFNWEECKKNVDGYSGAVYKSFTVKEEAVKWLEDRMNFVPDKGIDGKEITKYYAVAVGYNKGVFRTWEECRKLVEGYSGAKYQAFATEQEANEWLDGYKLTCQNKKVKMRKGISKSKAKNKAKKKLTESQKHYKKIKNIRNKDYMTESDYNALNFIGCGYRHNHSKYKLGR